MLEEVLDDLLAVAGALVADVDPAGALALI